MHSKLAGHLPLQDMIAQTLESARSKLAAAEEKEEGKKKGFVPFGKKKEEKSESKAHEKGESKKEEREEHEDGSEKTSSVLDFSDPYSMDKLASALEEFGDELLKEADSIENGGESKQGGEQLATMSPVGGKQAYTGAKATAKHQVTTGGVKATKDNPGAATANETDDDRAPGGTGAKYPAKGVLKTGAAALMAVVDQVVEEKTAGALGTAKSVVTRHAKDVGQGFKDLASMAGSPRQAASALKDSIKTQGLKGTLKGNAPALKALGATGAAAGTAAGGALAYKKLKEKKSSAVDFILDKLAEFHGGGETLDDQAAPVPSNEGRQLIANNKAPVSATKREAKGPGRKQLSEVLAEPAQTSSTDNTVQQNLRNAAKGGVKIAAVKAYLGKIAEAGCVCAGAGECDYCRMKASVDKKRADKKVKQSLGMPPMGPAPQAGGPMGGGSAGGM